MQRKISYRVYLPVGLKEVILDLLEKNPPEIRNFKRDKLLYILSLISEIPARNKRGGLSNKGFTNINTTLLRSFFYDYKVYVDYLKLQGIIMCDDHYIPGKKSKGYQLALEYGGLVRPACIQNPELIRSIKKHRNERFDSTKKYGYLKKWIDGLEIDSVVALEYIKQLYGLRMRNPEIRDWDVQKERVKEPIEQYNSAYINIQYLNEGRYHFFVDDRVGRLHTNLTNMQSDVRNFITWKGQPLVSVDISNSQPFLSTLLFNPSFYSTGEGIGEKMTLFSFLGDFSFPFSSFFSSSSCSSCSSCTTPPSSRPPLMLQKPLYHTEKEDVKLFIDLVKKGQLYEYLEMAFNKELGVVLPNRKSVKAAVFQVLFTDNHFIGQFEAAPKRIFKKLFPNVYDLFAAFKKQDSTFLPCLLQKIEARLILDIITKRISKEKPKAPIFTIHDSITTTVDNLDYVKQVMHEELEQHIGIAPNLKVEYWNGGQVMENLNTKRTEIGMVG
jgi:hypothetical protein